MSRSESSPRSQPFLLDLAPRRIQVVFADWRTLLLRTAGAWEKAITDEENALEAMNPRRWAAGNVLGEQMLFRQATYGNVNYLVQQAILNARDTVLSRSLVEESFAALADARRARRPNGEIKPLQVRVEVLNGQLDARANLQVTYNRLLAALDQGTPQEYVARFERWLKTGGEGRRREQEHLDAFVTGAGQAAVGFTVIGGVAAALGGRRPAASEKCSSNQPWQEDLQACGLPKCWALPDGQRIEGTWPGVTCRAD